MRRRHCHECQRRCPQHQALRKDFTKARGAVGWPFFVAIRSRFVSQERHCGQTAGEATQEHSSELRNSHCCPTTGYALSRVRKAGWQWRRTRWQSAVDFVLDVSEGSSSVRSGPLGGNRCGMGRSVSSLCRHQRTDVDLANRLCWLFEDRDMEQFLKCDRNRNGLMDVERNEAGCRRKASRLPKPAGMPDRRWLAATTRGAAVCGIAAHDPAGSRTAETP